ncbi:VWA domain-containing protein [Cytophagales bacterium LB-30]|uniref:VWA domain-containing protein n=1 Tax=Shiella aurantiaca TaxID=3058365 RepID=A0ABT8F1U6_9BACT|nr:VWA domain-containing protein [Shiella aurantiaca]MDN4164216.1 VWA domain-containing protein [Shiella aurantiaca]
MDKLNTHAKWWDFTWFSPSTFTNFDWQYPFILYGIALIPLFFLLRWLLSMRKNNRLELALPQGRLKSSPLAWLRHLPRLVWALFLSLLIIALARPQTTNEQVDQWTEGIDIVMAIDISVSMQMEDLKPNRLIAAKETAWNFVQGRLNDRMGVVIFAGDAYSLCPLTTDKELLQDYIEEINFDQIANRGTAIGSALAVATNRMRESLSQSKVVILLSDGDNTAGNIDPITAAQLASAYNIKIYTIGIGREGDVPYGKDFFGRTRMVANNMDETTLREIAEIGEGKFFRVADNEALQQVFAEIDRLEKTEIKETRFRNTFDYYDVYLRWALVFFAIWMLMKAAFLASPLED